MDAAAALADIEALRSALDEACDSLMTQAELGLSLASASNSEDPRICDVFAQIMSLCSFHDLASQRLSRLACEINGSPADRRAEAHLLNGPANAGGLDQGAADALFQAD